MRFGYIPGSSQIILYKVGNWNINVFFTNSACAAHLTFDTTGKHDLQMALQGNTISVYWMVHSYMSDR